MKEVELFLNTIISKGTKRSYQKNIELFLEYANISTLEEFKKLDTDDFYNWRNYLLNEKNNTPNSIKAKLSAISSFYAYLMSNPKYGVTINPIISGQIHKKTKGGTDPSRTTWLTEEEANRFMDACKNLREKAMCAIFVNTGLRVSELINLELDKFQTIEKTPNTTESTILITRKGGKKQWIYFNSFVTKTILEYLKVRKETKCNNLFVSNRGNPMSTQSIDRTIHKIQRKAGLNKNISAHSLRRTSATAMYNEGYDIKQIQGALGHNSSGTTDIYLKGLEDSAMGVFKNFIIGEKK